MDWAQNKWRDTLQMVEREREIMDTVISRQKRWLGHILRHDSLLRITLEGQMQGKKTYGRPRTMLLGWLLKTEEGNISYEELKMSAQDRSRWSQWRCKPAIGQNTAEIPWRNRLSVLNTLNWAIDSRRDPETDRQSIKHCKLDTVPTWLSRSVVTSRSVQTSLYLSEN